MVILQLNNTLKMAQHTRLDSQIDLEKCLHCLTDESYQIVLRNSCLIARKKQPKIVKKIYYKNIYLISFFSWLPSPLYQHFPTPKPINFNRKDLPREKNSVYLILLEKICPFCSIQFYFQSLPRIYYLPRPQPLEDSMRIFPQP